jgi:hypothetical protein
MNNLVVYYSSNSSFRTSSDTAACIVLLLFISQEGGAISNIGEGSMIITGSNFAGNTATTGNNILKESGDVTCDDVENTFESSGGNNDSAGNYPSGLCTSYAA